jgi:hypothetical protein
MSKGLLAKIKSLVQPKDAIIVGLFAEFIAKFDPNGHLHDEGVGKDITNNEAHNCLLRLRQLCELVEKDQNVRK